MPPAPHPRPPSFVRQGFTLVELLVVIVIIVVLATAGTFTLQNAMRGAKQSKCAGNLRNLGAAMHLYAADHDGCFPETTHTADLGQSWVYALESYLGTFDETRISPADPKARERLKARGTSYVLNSFLFVPEIDPFGEPVGPQLNRVSAIPEPSRTFLAFLCSDRTGVGPGNDHTHSAEWTSWTGVCRDITPDRFGVSSPDRSGGRSNYLFADGRVEAIPAGELKRRTDSGINIAWPPGLPLSP